MKNSGSLLLFIASMMCLFGLTTSFMRCLPRSVSSQIRSQRTQLNSYPIHDAAYDGDLEKVKELISNDKSLLTLVESEGNTALHFASKYGFMDMVVYLVEQGSEINFKNDRGRTSLIWACMYEDKEMAKYLVSKGGDLNAKNKDGQTALFYAKKFGFDKELLEAAKGVPIQPAKKSRGDW